MTREGWKPEIPLRHNYTLADLLAAVVPTDPTVIHGTLMFGARGVRGLEAREGGTWSLEEKRERFLRPWFAANRHASKSVDMYWLEFLECYDDVKHPLGGGTLERAWTAAEAVIRFPPEAAQFDDPLIRQCVLWCRELQRLAQPGPFYLSCASVMERFGLKHKMQARTWLRGLVAVGIITEEVKGSTETRKATRWRYLHPLDGDQKCDLLPKGTEGDRRDRRDRGG
jgi:hypothetical protein